MPELCTLQTIDAAMSQPIPLTLRDLLESLPQELYDEIYDLTFTPTTKVVQVSADRKAQIPNASLLQVNRTIRKSYIESLTLIGNQSDMMRCVENMSLPLRDQLTDVRTFSHKGEPRSVGCHLWTKHYHHYLADELNRGVWRSFSFESQMVASFDEKE